MVEGTSANNNQTNTNNNNNNNNSNNSNNNNNNNNNNSTGNNNTNNNRPRSKMARPKPVCLWQVHDVLKWYRRHCSEYLEYLELFSKHEITGRTLLRITDTSLKRMGIVDNCDRENIWREIVKQRLKTDIMEIRDMERIVNQHNIVKINHHHR